jgi:O-antigen/teichoic acid export membrane protein
LSGPTTSQLQTAAVSGSIWTSAYATTALPLAVVANIIVARALGPIEFGYLTTLMAAYVIATTVANMGISDATVQWGAARHVRGEAEGLAELVRRCTGFHIFIETPLIVAVTAAILHGAPWETQLVACLAAGVGMAIGTGAVVQSLLSRTALVARVAVVTNVALQVSVATAAATSRSGFTTWATRIVILNLTSVILLVLVPRTLRSAVLRPLPPWRWPEGFVPYAAKIGVGALVSLLVFSRSELFVLQARHLAVAAGVYALGFGVAAQLTSPIDALLGPMVPAAASLAAAAPERLAAAMLRGLRFTAVAAGGLAAVGIPVAAVLIATIYGQRFAQASELVLPLGLVSCVQSLNHPVTAFAYGMRLVGSMMLINIVAFAVDMGIAIATVGSLHAWGATIANATGQLVSLGGAAWLVKRELSLSLTVLAGATRAFAEGAVAAGCGWFVASVLTSGAVPAEARAAVGLFTGGAVFLAFQRIGLRALSHEDVAIFAAGMPARLRGPATRALYVLGFAP